MRIGPLLAVLPLLFAASIARADDDAPLPAERIETPALCDRVGPKNVVSTQPFAFIARGVSLSYERLLVSRFSLVALVGYRSTAQGDYGSNTIHGGLEGRVWIRPSVDIKCGMQMMSGPYLGLKAGVGHTRVVDERDDRLAGTSIGLTPMLSAGWRFVAFRRIEITPSIGAGFRADVDPPTGLVSTPKALVALNLSVGWMF